MHAGISAQSQCGVKKLAVQPALAAGQVSYLQLLQREKGLTFYACIVTDGEVSVAGEGPERPAPAVRAVQHRSDHTTRAPMVLPA